MKALTLTFALLLLCTGAVLAQTPDGQTPAEETVCDSETGAAYGLCNAYCEAMDCQSDSPHASETACTKVRNKFMNIAGHDLPCEAPPGCPAPPPGTTCPCVDFFAPDWANTLSAPGGCSDDGTAILKVPSLGAIPPIAANCNESPGCSSEGAVGGFLDTTPEEGAACVQLIRDSCN